MRDEVKKKLGAMANAVRTHEILLFEIFLKGEEDCEAVLADIQAAADLYTEELQRIISASRGVGDS